MLRHVYKAAVIGCGRIGCGFDDDPLRKVISTHATAYSKNPKTSLYALCDLDTTKLEKYGKKYSITNLFVDVDELLEKVKPDVISICTHQDTHEEITLKAARSGVKGIFCEKPIANTVSGAKNMIEACKKNNVVLIIDHQRRFDPLFTNVKKMIHDGHLGTIRHSVFYYTAGIFNTGTHIIDLMRYFFGDVVWVTGRHSSAEYSSTDPNIDGTLSFKNGAFGNIYALNVKDCLIFEQDILGSKGRLRILHSGFETEYYGISDSRYFNGYKEYEKTELPFEIPQERQYMVNGVNHMLDCIEKKTEPISSGTDGLRSLEIILALIESANNSSKITYLSSGMENTI